MEQILILIDLVKERMKWYAEDKAAYVEWKRKNPEKHSWDYTGTFRVTRCEIKRLSLVLRQEMIRFEKTL